MSVSLSCWVCLAGEGDNFLSLPGLQNERTRTRGRGSKASFSPGPHLDNKSSDSDPVSEWGKILRLLGMSESVLNVGRMEIIGAH